MDLTHTGTACRTQPQQDGGWKLSLLQLRSCIGEERARA